MRNIINRTTKIIGSVGSKAEKDDAYIQTYNMAVKSNAEHKKIREDIIKKQQDMDMHFNSTVSHMQQNGSLTVDKDNKVTFNNRIDSLSEHQQIELQSALNSKKNEINVSAEGGSVNLIRSIAGVNGTYSKKHEYGKQVNSIQNAPGFFSWTDSEGTKLYVTQGAINLGQSIANSVLVGRAAGYFKPNK